MATSVVAPPGQRQSRGERRSPASDTGPPRRFRCSAHRSALARRKRRSGPVSCAETAALERSACERLRQRGEDVRPQRSCEPGAEQGKREERKPQGETSSARGHQRDRRPAAGVRWDDMRRFGGASSGATGRGAPGERWARAGDGERGRRGDSGDRGRRPGEVEASERLHAARRTALRALLGLRDEARDEFVDPRGACVDALRGRARAPGSPRGVPHDRIDGAELRRARRLRRCWVCGRLFGCCVGGRRVRGRLL